MRAMNKIGIGLILTTITLSSLIGCSNSDQTTAVADKIKPVKAMTVQEESSPLTLEYIGTVNTADLKKYSFKVAGKIADIPVKKGQLIKKGDDLAQIDTKDLEYQLAAANQDVNQAEAQYNKAIKGSTQEQLNQARIGVTKAEEAYQYADDYYKKLEELYKNDGISKQDLDKAKLELEMRKADLETAKEKEQETIKGLDNDSKSALYAQLKQARIGRDQKQDMLNDATLKAEIDGQVADILFKSGEMVNAGYPVIIVKSNHMVVNVGVTSEDVDKIKEGQKALISANQKQADAEVSYISPLPDQQTRTYNVELELKDANVFKVGMITDVSFVIGEEKGIWVPILSVMANGKDFVYVVEKDHVIKKTVTLGRAKETKVLVKGLKDGEQIVIEGMKEITDGEKVKVQN